MSSVELHQPPLIPMRPNAPSLLRKPPGRPAKPLVLVPLPSFSHPLVFFIFLPATASPPKLSVSFVHSASLGTCQPFGAKPLGSVTANQLYSLPYFLPLAGSLS